MFNHCLSRNPRVPQSVQYLTGRTRSGGNSKIAQERGPFDLHLPPPLLLPESNFQTSQILQLFVSAHLTVSNFFVRRGVERWTDLKRCSAQYTGHRVCHFTLLIHGHLKLCFLNISIFAARFHLIHKQSWLAGVKVLPYSAVQYIAKAPSRLLPIFEHRENSEIYIA